MWEERKRRNGEFYLNYKLLLRKVISRPIMFSNSKNVFFLCNVLKILCLCARNWGMATISVLPIIKRWHCEETLVTVSLADYFPFHLPTKGEEERTLAWVCFLNFIQDKIELWTLTFTSTDQYFSAILLQHLFSSVTLLETTTLISFSQNPLSFDIFLPLCN